MRSAVVPPAEAELALLLCGTAERRAAARGRIAELAAAVDEKRLFRFLARQRMLVLLSRRLEESADRPLSPEVRALLADALARSSHRATMFVFGAEAVTERLETEGIPALSLKGVALAKRVHGDPAARDYSDLDVLVPPEHLGDAARGCRSLGYGEPLGDGADGSLPTLHLLQLAEGGIMPPLELHWRVHWYERRFAADMLARSSLAGGTRVPEPIDELASLLLFYARDGFVGLRHSADIAAWWDRFGDQLEPGALRRHCDAYPALASAWRASARVSERLIGLPGGRLIGEPRLRRRREGIAARLANWELTGDPDQISADAKLVDGLCTPSGQRGGFVRRQVVPGEARIREYYRLPPDARARTALWTVLHPPKMLVRFALGLWGARRASCPARGLGGRG